MKNNKLYTVNKWNMNLFDGGGELNKPKDKNPFSKQNIGNTLGTIGQAVAPGIGGLISGGYDAGGVGNAIGSVGNSIGSAVGAVNPVAGAVVSLASQAVGGLVNRSFGTKVNQAKLNAVNEANSYYNNFVSKADSFDDVKGIQAQGNFSNPYKNGWLTSAADKKNAALKRRFEEGKAFAENSLANNIGNIGGTQLGTDLGNYSAFGGLLGDFGSGALGIMQNDKYINAINNRTNAIAKNNIGTQSAVAAPIGNSFAGGGDMEFVNSFTQDPIQAAMQYIQSQDALEAQQEAAAEAAAQQKMYEDLQTRLLNAETQNQGLQALIDDQARSIATLQEAQKSAAENNDWKDAIIAENEARVAALNDLSEKNIGIRPMENAQVRRTPLGKGADNWKYIEGQLKKSGKFNDVQIEGIKYNLQRESGIGQYDGGDSGSARGLAQWRGARIPKDMSLEGQTKYLIDTLSNYDGTDHWIGKDYYKGFLNARTPEEAHYYIARGYERPAEDVWKKLRDEMKSSLKNNKAFGGELGTNGADFTNGLLEVNAGSSHEDNPYGGVQMGFDHKGVPNYVEEGETVFNDYVFSNRLEVPDFMYKELGLGGAAKKSKDNKGLTFADASKKLAKESVERPNNPMDKEGLNAALSKLAQVQETEKARIQAEQANAEMMVQNGMEEGLMAACGGKLNKYAKGGNILKQAGPIDRLGSRHKYGKELEEEVGQQKPTFTFTPNPDNTIQPKEEYTPIFNNSPFGRRVVGMSRIGQESPFEIRNEYDPFGMKTVISTPIPEDAGKKDNTEGELTRGNRITYPTWMRYAPAFGAGIMTLTDALGLTNKPDYTYANKIEAAANAAGFAPNIKYKPLGDYMRYVPLDRMFHSNVLQANARATDRAIANSTSPSRNAALLASGYNATNSLGNLARQAEEYNRGIYERTKEFNRKTNMFNSQMDLEAQMANARYNQQAKQFQLSGLGQAAALRDAIDQRIGAAKSANITNLLTSLGNIGRENFAFNQINSDRSRRHGVYRNGVSEDWIAKDYRENKRAFGGEVEKYQKNKKKGRNK